MTGTGDTYGTTDDRTVIRSEEKLAVSTQRRVSGRVRLQKFVTTEIVTVEVPVRREEVRLVHEPVDGGDFADVTDSPAGAAGRDDLVLVLHEERPVVTTEVVPVERVRVVVDEVTTTEDVSGEVRVEHVDLDRDPSSAPR